MKVHKKLALRFIRARLNFLSVVNLRLAARLTFRLFCTPFLKFKGTPMQGGEQLTFLLNDKRVHGQRFNHPQERKALVLHGFSSSSHNFKDYIDVLVSKGYEVLAFDAPAHGISEGTTVNAMEYSQMIKEIIQRYGPVQSFVSHSFGGISLALALEELPHDESTRVVFIAPATETKSAIDQAFDYLQLNNPRLRKAVDDLIINISGHPTEWFSIRRSVKNLRAKVLWFHDYDDDITPVADALKVKDDNNPHVKFVLTQALGHRKIYRDPEVKKQIFEFL